MAWSPKRITEIPRQTVFFGCNIIMPSASVTCVVGNQLGYLLYWYLAGSSQNRRKGYRIEGRTVKQSAETVK